jgi:ribosomal protein L21
MVGGEQEDGEPEIGAPLVEGEQESAEVLEQGKGARIGVVKK